MPSFEILLYLGIAATLAIGSLMLWIALRESQPNAAAQALDEGHFAKALKVADTSPAAPERDLRVAAIAAKHLGEWATSTALLDRLLVQDSEDAEALLEKGLVLTYSARFDEALEAFDLAAAIRSDLGESIGLHRAYALYRRGDLDRARRLFEEIEVPLETKLRSDMGSGEPVFCEWFLHAAALWGLAEDWPRASWARGEAERSAGDSRLPELVSPSGEGNVSPSGEGNVSPAGERNVSPAGERNVSPGAPTT